MAGPGSSEDLINFDLIETHKENIQQLPGGRSAQQLVKTLTPLSSIGPFSTSNSNEPSLDDTRTLNDAIRREYEIEVTNIADSDDPLDVFDRYVKWTLNAYPSAQATPQSQLLPLLERATKTFLSSAHYKNDPRYLKLWLHYIRWFSDAPRETFAYLARHSIGERLALFYEEFAAWLEGGGRWAQAEEVYTLGVEREARPAERLMRKFAQFKQRHEARPVVEGEGGEPSSPALPTVRPALAAKIDPFASSTPRAGEAQTTSAAQDGGMGPPKTGRPKMAIFSDADNPTPPPTTTTAATTNGWQSIGSLQERKKENTIAAKPWVGETLKAGSKLAKPEKMSVFKDKTIRTHDTKKSDVPESVVNPKTGKAERVFVDLEAVYPNHADPSVEMSFDELRARRRGWMDKDWGEDSSLKVVQAITGTAQPSLSETNVEEEKLAKDFQEKVVIEEAGPTQQQSQSQDQEVKPVKQKKMRLREVKQETQTVKANLSSPTGPKIRRKMNAEPTMTFHSKAATNDIYDLFNQPLSCDAPKEDTQSGGDSEFEEDGYSTAGESTGTGIISGAISECAVEVEGEGEGEGEDDTGVSVSARTTMTMMTSMLTSEENTSAAEAVGEWTEFSTSKHIPRQQRRQHQENSDDDAILTPNSDDLTNPALPPTSTHSQTLNTTTPDISVHQTMADNQETKTPVEQSFPQEQQDAEYARAETRFVPIPPEDYDPDSMRGSRDPARAAQNRLPFMTPIVEKTESSMAAETASKQEIEQIREEWFGPKSPDRFALKRNRNPPSPSKLAVGNLLLDSPDQGKKNASPSNSGRRLVGRKSSFEEYMEDDGPPSPSPRSKRASNKAQLDEEEDDVSPSPRKRVHISQVAGSPTKILITTTPLTTPPSSVSNTPERVGSIFIKPTFPASKYENQETIVSKPIITDARCNPTDFMIRTQILDWVQPPPTSHLGFNNHPLESFGRYAQIQKYAKKMQLEFKTKSSPRKTPGGGANNNSTDKPQPLIPQLVFKGASRVYAVKRELGQGAFAPVYLVDSIDPEATDKKPTVTDKTQRGNQEALKAESPPSQAIWEFHIIRTVHARLTTSTSTISSRALTSIICAHELHAFADEAYLVLDFAPTGTLLDLVNVVKAQNRHAGKAESGLDEPLAMFFAIEVLRTMEALFSVGILHGDLKGDNYLLRLPPPSSSSTSSNGNSDAPSLANLGPYSPSGHSGWSSVGITLIDFGRGIDVRNFSPRVGFIADWPATPLDAPEIREARPWLWQIDLWAAAGVVHSCLFGRYLETVVNNNTSSSAGAGLSASATNRPGRTMNNQKQYRLKENFKRYWQGEIWAKVFDHLLNPAVVEMPDDTGDEDAVKGFLGKLAGVRGEMEVYLEAEGERKGLRTALRRVESAVGK